MNPDIAYGIVNDRYQVVWGDNPGGDWDIYGRMVLPSGVPGGVNFALIAVASSQVRPSIAYDNANNEFLTFWQDSTLGIRGRAIRP